MQLSNYTVQVEDARRNETIWFNTLNGALAYSAPDFSASSNLDVLEPMGFALADRLEQSEFLQAIYQADQSDTSVLSLCIAPSYACNLACPYCYEQRYLSPQNLKLMNARTQDAVVEFVRAYHARMPFAALKIIWYGGEPVLALDMIEALSTRLMEFAQVNGLEYSAMMMSNATLIGDKVAKRLKLIGVHHVMPTLDGIGANHDCRRPTKSGTSSYEQVFAALFALASQGINVGCNLNLDRKNYDDYVKLRRMLAPYPNLDIFASQLRDYNGNFASGNYAKDVFDPYLSRREYALALFELYQMLAPSRESLCACLKPARLFCQGQMKNYFVIDSLGDMYTCDGYMGDPDKRIASIFDPLDVEALRAMTNYSPFVDPLCVDCSILPLCKGECGWERGIFAENCHALKYTLDLYVQAYRDTFPNQGKPYEQLVAPLPPAEVLRTNKNALG